MRNAHAKSNQRIYNDVSRTVTGHDEAKKVLINLVNRSQLRYYQRYGLANPIMDGVKLSNCLLIGESGTGKTFLIETLAEIMEFPFIKIDATELNPTGATGGLKKKDVIKKITEEAQWLVAQKPHLYFTVDETIEQMIVFVDEIDKLGQQLSSDWNAHVQSNFLTLFENKGELSGVTFVFAGAFSGMNKQEFESKKIGFSNHKEEKKSDGDLAQAVIKFGMIPELVGRFNHIVQLDKLTKDDYKKILKNTIMPRMSSNLEYYGINEFILSDEQMNELVESAMKSGLGVRALETGVNKLMTQFEFDPTTYDDEEQEDEEGFFK